MNRTLRLAKRTGLGILGGWGLSALTVSALLVEDKLYQYFRSLPRRDGTPLDAQDSFFAVLFAPVVLVKAAYEGWRDL